MTLDFYSTHEYPSDWNSPPIRDNMEVVFMNARNDLGIGYTLIYSEFNSGLDEPHHDDTFAAAFVINTVATGDRLVDAVSYWAVSDIFEEGGQVSAAFQQQFGIQTVHGVRKPVWRALELLHWTGDMRIPVNALSNPNSVSLLSTRNATHVALFVINYEWTKNPCNPQKAQVTVQGAPPSIPLTTPVLYTIDSSHANPVALWRQYGSPEYPTTPQIKGLHAASEMGKAKAQYRREGDMIVFDLKLEPYSVSAIFFQVK